MKITLPPPPLSELTIERLVPSLPYVAEERSKRYFVLFELTIKSLPLRSITRLPLVAGRNV